MSYSGAPKAKEARESLGKALEALQQDANVPDDVMNVAQNIAQSVGALFEAERAPGEQEGKSSLRSALGSLTQTLALLQDLRSTHTGIATATATIAEVMSSLYPLTTVPSRMPAAPEMPEASAPPVVEIPKAAAAPVIVPEMATPSPVAARVSLRPGSSSGSIRPAPNPSLKKEEVEANIGATTESNFFVGFSGDINDGGVFLATYETLPVGTPVHALVTLPGGFEFRTDGFVRFVHDPMDFDSESEPGIGIQFLNLNAEARDLVMRFIRKRAPMFYDD